MNGMPSAAVISLSLPAVSIAICLDSTTQGPAMTNSGWSRPTSKPQSFMSGHALDLGQTALDLAVAFAIAHGSVDEGRKQRMAVARRGREFGVELATDEPGMARQFHHFREVLAWRARGDLVTLRLQQRHIGVVDFVAMTMALVDPAAIDLRGQRTRLDRAGLRTEPHRAA